jgi:hypothetical protein
MEDMLGKVSKIKYFDHDVHDMENFLNLAEEIIS